MLRKTKQRDSIFRAVMNTTSHPTAEWVYQMVRQEIPNISLGTVYRNLKLLAQNGQIQALEGPGGLSRFDSKIVNHCHFRCQQCRRLFDLDKTVDKTLEKEIVRQTGFKINSRYLEFSGLCSDCQK
jgi:Fur family transcriptional regulator, peroxide stress response regulator